MHTRTWKKRNSGKQPKRIPNVSLVNLTYIMGSHICYNQVYIKFSIKSVHGLVMSGNVGTGSSNFGKISKHHSYYLDS